MPYSDQRNREAMHAFLAGLNVTGTIVDLGAGAGQLGHLARQACPHASELIGVEIWAPYVKDFGLETIYDRVIIADLVVYASAIVWGARFSREVPDIYIAGDVMEHLVKHVAAWAIKCFQADARLGVLVAMPIGPWPQDGTPEGNVWEAHRSEWSCEEMLAMGAELIWHAPPDSPQTAVFWLPRSES